MDEVLFRLATLLTGAKKDDQAREFFHRLIKDYPNSKYIPDAYLAFAEHPSKGRDGRRAEVLREGRAVPEVQRLPLRRLQEGVVLRQPGRLQDRARDVRRRRAPDAGRRSCRRRRGSSWRCWRRRRRRTSSRRTPTSAGRTRRASSSAKVGGDYAPKMMELLAELLLGGGQGAGIDARLQADHRRQHGEPARLRVAEQGAAQHAVAAGLRQGAGDAGAGAPGRRSTSRAPPSRSAGAGGGVPRTRSTTPPASWRSSGTARRRGRRTGDTYELAERAYRLFLAHFADDKEAYEMRFYRGELLWALRRWKDAAEQYTEVVEVEPGRQVPARGGVRGGAGLEERAHASATSRGSRSPERGRAAPGRGRGVRQARAAADPGQPAEDDRRVSHLREAGARRARAAGDALPRGVHLLRPRPVRSRRAAVPRGGAEVPEARAGGVLGEPVPRRAEHGVQDQGGAWRGRASSSTCRSWRATPEFAQQMVVADQRRLRSGRARPREARRRTRNAAGRSWPPPRRCRPTPSTPSACGTRASAFRTRTWSGRRSRRGTR